MYSSSSIFVLGLALTSLPCVFKKSTIVEIPTFNSLATLLSLLITAITT